MRLLLPRIVAAGACALAVTSVAAYESPLTARLITEALTIGRSAAASAGGAFHVPYRLPVNAAPVDYIDVVTPFRRIVIEAQTRQASGQGLMSQRDALAIAAQSGDIVEVYVELTFHPLNTFVGVPDYAVVLRGIDGAVVTPRDIRRVPRFGPRLDGTPLPSAAAPPVVAGSDPLTGGTIVAAFATTRVGQLGAYDIVVDDGGKELARQRVNFGELR